MTDISVLEGKNVLVTGATGLIGSALVKRLLEHDGKRPIGVVALVRNEAKAKKIFENYVENSRLKFWVADVCDLRASNMDINYIVHAACQTASKAFSERPVETILSTVNGMRNVLELARVNNIESMVYLSTLEVYGTPDTDEKITEDHPSDLVMSSPRSSYPEVKRLCENLGASYHAEYGVPAKSVRLCQTFGEGVSYDDGRVFAEFARCAIEGRDIVLNTKGETKRSYLYIGDAVEAILTVLISGKAGEIYNAANEQTYCSIYEMATLVANRFGNGNCKVIINQARDIGKFGYAPTLKINMDCSKLRALGWTATEDLEGAYARMINEMKTRRYNA